MSHTRPHLIHLQYRPDIDGLRAIAIVSVVAFHAFPHALSGGFIGVDVFFVISGFLISSIIFSSLERSRFNLVEFYIRRIKRIVPALVLVLVSCLIAGWILLFSDEYRQLGTQIFGGAYFVQNFILLKETGGYFDSPAGVMPLLHLWSLAIEEQFYIFWPLLLVFVWRREWNFLRITGAIGIMSFMTNLYVTDRHPASAFFEPGSRFWELMVGGVLAYLVLHKPQYMERFGNAQSIIGAVLIVCGLIFLNKGRNFPGAWAMLPTFGAFLTISGGASSWINSRLLANKWMVWIGLISYPLYLWHWPLLVFMKIVYVHASVLQNVLVLIIAVILSWLTYRFVERPFRYGGSAGVKSLALVVMLFSIGVTGLAIALNKGFPDRSINALLGGGLNSAAFGGSRISDGSCERNNSERDVSEEVCHSNTKEPTVLFVGDSHAMALYSAIYANEFSIKAMLVSGHSCPIYPNLTYTPSYRYSFGNNCTDIALRAIDVARRYKSIKTVVLMTAAAYASTDFHVKYSDGHQLATRDAFIRGNGYFVYKMLSLGKRVVFVEDVPELQYAPEQCVRLESLGAVKGCGMYGSVNASARRVYEGDLKTLKDEYPEMNIFNTNGFFCANGRCTAKRDNQWLYNDVQHITVFASNILLHQMKLDGYL